ncbi:uncharacterized protein LOC114294801 [Camellia sinensis]|uniref:uncharacterized protein LOC114294801 n=1 Tax=Camellia sinensis TaxID=4442 RepID=UPI00103647B1|nr:uncharacterized protein LOC114294801 [Camellia sinensis]
MEGNKLYINEGFKIPHLEAKSGGNGESVTENVSEVRNVESSLEVVLELGLPMRIAEVNRGSDRRRGRVLRMDANLLAKSAEAWPQTRKNRAEELRLSWRRCKNCLSHCLHRAHSGQVKIHNFFRVLRLKACNLSEKIFGVLDVEKKVINDYDYDYLFAQNGLVAYKDGKLIGTQSLRSYLGEEKLKGFINFGLHYIADLDIAIKMFVKCRHGLQLSIYVKLLSPFLIQLLL